MNDKNFIGLIVGLFIIFGAAVFFFGGSDDGTTKGFIGDPLQIQTGEPKTDENGNPTDEQVQPADHIIGSVDAPVQIIEFADFECPACYAFYPEIKQIKETYGDDVAFVFRHFPLSNLHPNAVAAHRAAEAAARQGKFWEMHDLLYENQFSWSVAQSGLDVAGAQNVFAGYASQLNLDIDQYKADLESQAVFDYVDSQIDSGQKLGITGTPTIFLNGEEVSFRSFEEFSAAIDEILGNQETQNEN